jgi:hypothetical protein
MNTDANPVAIEPFVTALKDRQVLVINRTKNNLVIEIDLQDAETAVAVKQLQERMAARFAEKMVRNAS